jgi:phosphoribosylglycinamide formyltransferase 1
VTKPRWALFISGQGTNLSALIDQKWDLDIALVVSSSTEAAGLKRARRAGIQTHVLETKTDWENTKNILQQHKVNHIFLLGFMKIVPSKFLQNWPSVILNVHPSLLPRYPGLKSIQKAHEDGAPTGVTVHHVSAEVDGGQIVYQKQVLSSERIQSLSLSEVERRTHWCEYALVRRAVERRYA